MKGGVTKRIEDTIAALEKGELKNALFLTDRREMEREHAWVEEAARKALDDRENAKKYMMEAKDKLTATITAPLDDTSLEGVEEMLKDTTPRPELPKQEKTDEELYEECQECHIANAIVAASEICDRHPQTVCTLLTSRLDREDVEPEEWLKVLVEARDKSEGEARQEFGLIVDDLMEYLERKSSPFLEGLTSLLKK
ncbi:hypothetical protein ES705_21521 [subsurface metagenome]|jgi:hypothetical protein